VDVMGGCMFEIYWTAWRGLRYCTKSKQIRDRGNL